MTSGTWTTLAASCLLWIVSPCRAAAPDPARLVAAMQRTPPARTAYTEVRFSGLLERPLILHGELEYLGPGKLAKRVDAPYRETMTVADGQASVRRGDRPERRFALAQAPELDGFLRGFAALLGGDAATLAADFELAASGDARHWRLVLTPRDARLKRRIAAIEVDGAGGDARCFHTREADGDASVLLVESLAATKLEPHAGPGAIDALCRGIAPR
jgi:hypothetical protein